MRRNAAKLSTGCHFPCRAIIIPSVALARQAPIPKFDEHQEASAFPFQAINQAASNPPPPSSMLPARLISSTITAATSTRQWGALEAGDSLDMAARDDDEKLAGRWAATRGGRRAGRPTDVGGRWRLRGAS